MAYIGSMSGTAGSSYTDYSRISGLATGLDTESMINAMMQVARQPLDRLLQQKQIWQWRQEDYRTVNNALRELRDKLFSAKLQSTYLTKTTTTTDSKVVTATAASSATPGTYTISVSQLASAAAAVSGKGIANAGETFDPNASLFSQQSLLSTPIAYDVQDFSEAITVQTDANGNLFAKLSHDIVDPGSFTLNIDSTEYSLANGNLVINGTPAEGQVALDTTTGKIRLGDGVASEGQSLAAKYDYGFSFSINDLQVNTEQATLTFDPARASLNDLISLVNRNQTAGVTMAYDASSGRVLLTAKATGENSAISLTGKLLTETLALPVLSAGKNAEFTINGVLTTTSSTNTYTINGTTLTFAGEGTATITVASNTDAIVDSIKSFVEQYNTTLKTMTDLYYQKRNRDYPPLTEAQKEAMKDDQIEKWEKMARSGMLANDTTLGSAIFSLRQLISSVVEGQPISIINGKEVTLNTLGSIGIGTSNWWRQGQLTVNEEKLRQAVEADPEAVMRLFTNPNATGSLTDTSDPKSGLAVRLYNTVNNSIKTITDTAGTSADLADNSYISKRIRDIDKRAYELQRRLDDKLVQYYNQFTRLEQAINRMNAQSMYLMSMFNGQ
ncbi:MAG: flagellar filament capping protein FliD [Firmicutes bacterium]|nr:flagellar filament capping protein FliD [Bacillota bacterium]